MLSLIASTLIVAPDYTIQMGKTISPHALCRTLLISQKTFTGHDGRISNYQPCTIELGEGAGACVIQKGKRTAHCWLYNKPANTLPRPRIAGFTPDYTPPPKGQQIGTGTRMLAIFPLGQIPIVQPLIDLFKPKPKVKPKRTWADRQECINRELDRQINAGEKVDNVAARRKCGG